MQNNGKQGLNPCVLPVFLSILIVSLLSCKPSHSVEAFKGELSLFTWSFQKDGPALLGGDWAFQYGESEKGFAPIPSNWKGSGRAGHRALVFGYAEYALHVILPPDDGLTLMLKAGEIGTASSVYLNGNLAAQTGIPGRTAAETTPDVRIRYIPVPEGSRAGGERTLDILIQAANFDDSNGGGIWGPIYLGTTEQIEHLRYSLVIRESFMAGLFFIVFLYYLVIYFYRRTDLTSLLFALICVSFFLRQSVIGEKILYLLFPVLPWRFLVRLEYFSLYSLAPLYILFFRSLFPHGFLRSIQNILTGIGIAGCVAVAFLPVPAFIATLLPFQIYWIFLFVFNYYILIVSLREKQADAWIFIASFTILVTAAVNDILLTRLYVPTQSLVTLAQAVFIFFQSLALSRRFAREYRRSRNLEELNTHLSELDEARMRFFTASSHELRTPVTLITTPLEAIMNGRYGDTISRTAPVFELVKRNCDRLKRLSDELLDFLRFDSGSVTPSLRPLDLGPYLENYAALFAPDAVRRGIQLDVKAGAGSDTGTGTGTGSGGDTGGGTGMVILTDPVLLETVVLNLLSNALKHTPLGGRISLSLSRSGGTVSFTISDTGEGIGDGQLPHLFERFTAASIMAGTGYSGFGIGLPLSAEIVKTLGGTLGVSSRIDEGTRFTVSFPFHDGLPLQSALPSNSRISTYLSPSVRKGAAGLTPILVVDDDSDMLLLLEDTLSSSFDVHPVSSGAEAIAAIKAGLRPRVIVSDVMMPVMDGFALREKFAAMDECAGVPFLFLSAKADPLAKKAGLASGAVDYILKPFSIEELSAKIASLASLAQAERERLEKKIVAALRTESSPVTSGTVDWRSRALGSGMTERDLEVLALVIRGMSDKEIGAELDCSSRTVSNRISALLKRTGTASRAGLIAYITGNG